MPIMRNATDASPAGATSALPWGVAFLALLALVAAFAGKNFGSAKGSRVDGSANALPTAAMDGQGAQPAAGAAGGMPDIANMSANERASRLYNRAMTAAEQGQVDSAAFFAEMAVAAHGMIDNISIDERYHMARAAEIIAETETMRAQGDTILQQRPTSLFGLMLSASAARARGDSAAAKGFDARLLAALEPELATSQPDYDLHRAEIDRAAAAARRAR
ncbi:MAG: hypothetical protein ABIW79_11470 [Gemmatimonas sp.]